MTTQRLHCIYSFNQEQHLQRQRGNAVEISMKVLESEANDDVIEDDDDVIDEDEGTHGQYFDEEEEDEFVEDEQGEEDDIEVERPPSLTSLVAYLLRWDAVVSSVAELRTVHLHADATVPGQLAFRLVGNRHSGVYVFGMNLESQQASILDDGDKLLLCNGISLQGFTCEQVANVLRLSLCHDGTLTLVASRTVEMKEKLEERKAKRTYHSQQVSCIDKSHPIRVTSPLHTSDYIHRRHRITAFEAEKESSKRMSAIGEGMSSILSSISIFNKLQGNEESTSLLNPLKEPSTTANKKKEMTNYYMMDGQSEVELVGDSRYRCPICLKYTGMKRLHMLRHDWISGARRLFPTSHSEFFIGRSTSEYTIL